MTYFLVNPFAETSEPEFGFVSDKKWESSIAVLPFKNMTGDTLLNIWQEGLPRLLVTHLSTAQELRVIDVIENMGYDKTVALASNLSQEVIAKAKPDFLLNGEILRFGDSIRLGVRLLKGNNQEIETSETLQCSTVDDFFDKTEVLSNRLKNHFQIKVMEQNVDYDLRNVLTHSAEAYRYYVQGMEEFYKDHHQNAIDLALKAIEIDSNFTMAQLFLAYFYLDLAWFGDSRYLKVAGDWQKKAYSRKKYIPLKYQFFMEAHRCEFEKKPKERIGWIKKYLQIDSQSWEMWYNLGWIQNYMLGQVEQSLDPMKKAMELSIEWGNDDRTLLAGEYLAFTYTELERYQEALTLLNKLLEIVPEEKKSSYEDYIASIEGLEKLKQGDTTQVTILYNLRLREWEKEGLSEAEIARRAGNFYYKIDKKKTERFYRERVALEPDNKWALNGLAYLLIDEDINVNEGVAFAERAYEIDSSHYNIMDTVGWGYFKQGKFKLAVEILEKSESRTAKYDRLILEHLEKAKSALQNAN